MFSTRFLPAFMLLFGAAPAVSGVLYELGGSSDQQIGCFAPCECPVLIRAPVTGTFRLTHLGFDGLFDHYAVTDIDWRVPRESGWASVSGAGHYRVGGEVARQQQLTLDLSIAGVEAQHFDSGLVGESDFPKLDVAVAVHGFFCWDTTFTIQAVPQVLPAAGLGTSLELGPAYPNPFRGSTRFDLLLPAATRITATVHDARGRAVATIAKHEWLDAGPHVLVWDGASDEGVAALPGIYFMRVVAGETGRITTRPLARLKAR
jgi:hypothetical protein